MAKTLKYEINKVASRMTTALWKKYLEISKKFVKELKREFNKSKRDVIKKWYDSYYPKYYIRTLDMYKIPKIKINGIDWNISYSSDYMTKWHRVSHEYIYTNSFVNGYHGGADDFKGTPKPFYEQPHPNPGIPYWRKPIKITNEKGETILAPWPPKDGDPTTDDFPYRYRYWGKPAKQTRSPENMLDNMLSKILQNLVDKYKSMLSKEWTIIFINYIKEMQDIKIIGGD